MKERKYPDKCKKCHGTKFVKDHDTDGDFDYWKCAVEDCPWDDRRTWRNARHLWQSYGHAGALYQNEIYYPSGDFRKAKAYVIKCGAHFSPHRVFIFMEPHSQNVITNPTRSQLVLSGEGKDIQWEEMSREFRDNLPPEIIALTAEHDSSSCNPRIKQALRSVYDYPTQRRKKKVTENVEVLRSVEAELPVETKVPKPPGGPMTGTGKSPVNTPEFPDRMTVIEIQPVIADQIVKIKKTRTKPVTTEHPPEVIWLSGEKVFESLKNEAAQYEFPTKEKGGEILANFDFLQKEYAYLCEKHCEASGTEVIVRDAMEYHYGMQYVQVVLGLYEGVADGIQTKKEANDQLKVGNGFRAVAQVKCPMRREIEQEIRKKLGRSVA